ncbi:MAG: hypothetical protein WKF70_13575 [Chitinophagaceae bacterium]
MNKFNHFVGIDISKAIFDAALIVGSDTTNIKHQVFKQNAVGFAAFSQWLDYNSIPEMKCSFAWNTPACTPMGLLIF